jgi:hypothetical protein
MVPRIQYCPTQSRWPHSLIRTLCPDETLHIKNKIKNIIIPNNKEVFMCGGAKGRDLEVSQQLYSKR